MRRFLVHEYHHINLKKNWNTATVNVPSFEKYLDAIQDHLEDELKKEQQIDLSGHQSRCSSHCFLPFL